MRRFIALVTPAGKKAGHSSEMLSVIQRIESIFVMFDMRATANLEGYFPALMCGIGSNLKNI